MTALKKKWECKICSARVSYEELEKHLEKHEKSELIPHVSWWMRT